MLEAHGDIWGLAGPEDVVVITTNPIRNREGGCVMGRGIALQAAERFPHIPKLLGSLLDCFGNRAFSLGRHDGYRLATMPVKHHWRAMADLNLIEQSANQLVEMADKFGWQRIFVPRPGCGNGRLRWEQVRPIIEPIFDDRFVVVSY